MRQGQAAFVTRETTLSDRLGAGLPGVSIWPRRSYGNIDSICRGGGVGAILEYGGEERTASGD